MSNDVSQAAKALANVLAKPTALEIKDETKWLVKHEGPNRKQRKAMMRAQRKAGK